MIVSIFIFLIIFSVIVISHEFGHYAIARRNGIRVNEFDIGMGPVLYRREGTETDLCIRLLPIGGACMFEQEDGLETVGKDEKGREIRVEAAEPEDGSFAAAKVGARIATVFAGPLFNFILAFILSLFVVGMTGSDPTTIDSVLEGYPAQQAGLQAGDRIISIDGERVYLYREVSFLSGTNQGESFEVVYERDGKRYTTTI